MTYFGAHTLHDCHVLHAALAPKVARLRASHGALRASWEASDIFGAERFRRDLAGLEGRWSAAEEMLRRTRPGRRADMTPAEATYTRMVRAVRQGGASAEVRRGDLAELSRRMQHAGAKIAGFGDDPLARAVHTFQAWAGGLRSLKDCADMIAVFNIAIPDLGANFDRIQPDWSRLDLAEVQAFYRDLFALQTAWNAAVNAVTPRLNAEGPSAVSPAQPEWDALNAATATVVPLNQRLAQARAKIAASGVTPPVLHERPLPQPTADSRDAFMRATDPKGSGILSAMDRLGANLVGDTKAAGDTWYTNPWILGGVATVGTVAVVGYTLSQVRALRAG